MGTEDRSGRWTWLLLRRALAYAFWGGLDVAAMGGPLGILVGAVSGGVLASSGRWADLVITIGTFGLMGVFPGMLLGGVIGVLLFLGIGMFSRPGAGKKPPKQLVAAIDWGMTWAVLVLTSSSLVLIGGYFGFDGAVWGGSRFTGMTNLGREGGELLRVAVVFGIPAAMAIGAGLGAVVGLRRESRRESRRDYIGD